MTVKILVVDDEPDLEVLVRQQFRKSIREKKYDFVFARNGVEALERLEQDDEIGLVLSDINMPVMDGLTLLSKLNDSHPKLKTVMVSAYGDMPNIREAMNRGAFDFLTKPIDFQDFEVTVSKTLVHLHQMKQNTETREQLASIQRELRLAAEIQESILPRLFPPFPTRNEFDIHAEMIPAREVGGDFYDFFLVDEHRLGVVIGDVSGKGVAAAIFMAIARTLMRITALAGSSPGECLQSVNNLVTLDNPSGMFVTLFYGILDTRTGVFEFGSGGHNPPILLRADGAVEDLPDVGSTPLGIFASEVYETGQVVFRPGDSLFLYTDGITESTDAEGKMFSFERLVELLPTVDPRSMNFVVRDVIAAVRRHSAEAPQSDDITALALRYLGKA